MSKNQSALYQAFVEEQDSIYYEGYVESLTKEDYARFNFEFLAYCAMFSKKIVKKFKKS
jgi:hypothetical protein